MSLLSESGDPDVSSVPPSKLASNSLLFRSWRARARVIIESSPPKDVLSQFYDLYRLEALPKALQGPLPNPRYETEAEFQRTIQEWATTMPNTEEDKYHIMDEIHVLALAHFRIHGMSHNHTKERGRRRGVHEILEIAFRSLGSHCEFTTEERYRLVQSDSNPDAQSDTMITLPFQDIEEKLQLLMISFTDHTLIDHLYWSPTDSLDKFSIILFPGEFKHEDATYNMNQLIMVLTTAQSQRKALGLENSIIMGATSCGGCVRIYSSYWDSQDKSIIRIYEHKQQFDLMNPTEIIRLYVFCVKLGNSLQEKFIPQLRQFVAPTEMEIRRLMWRSADTTRRPRRKGTATCSIGELRSDNRGRNQGRNQGGSDSHGGYGSGNGDGGLSGGIARGGTGNGDRDGDVGRGRERGSRSCKSQDDVEGTSKIRDNRNDWNTQLISWKNEAAEGAKEASVMSGEGRSLTKSHLKQFRSDS